MVKTVSPAPVSFLSHPLAYTSLQVSGAGRMLHKAILQTCLFLIHVYRKLLSPLLGPRCRFYPSCSAYALEALQQHGLLHGALLSIKRLLRCHPGSPGGIDEVPAAHTGHNCQDVAHPDSRDKQRPAP